MSHDGQVEWALLLLQRMRQSVSWRTGMLPRKAGLSGKIARVMVDWSCELSGEGIGCPMHGEGSWPMQHSS